MKDLYLTIDDGPSDHTDDLVDFLEDQSIPAILFVRGEFLSENPKPIVRAIEKGFSIGNHLYSHQRVSDLDFVTVVEEIEHTETMIDAAYVIAEKKREHKLLRFPHMDRGCGGQVVEYDKFPEYREVLKSIFLEGLNAKDTRPDNEMLEKKHKIQIYLEREGYAQPFKGITHSFFTETEMAGARDCLYTYSSCDWMLTPRHKGKWPQKSVQDLIGRMDRTPYLHKDDSADVLLIHDDRENLLDVTKSLVQYWRDKGARFQAV